MKVSIIQVIKNHIKERTILETSCFSTLEFSMCQDKTGQLSSKSKCIQDQKTNSETKKHLQSAEGKILNGKKILCDKLEECGKVLYAHELKDKPQSAYLLPNTRLKVDCRAKRDYD